MDKLHLQHCVVDLSRAKVHLANDTKALTTKEVALLRYLAERPSEIVTREDLLVDVWGYAEGVFSRAVDTTMRRLRNKVEHTPAEPDHLTTVHGEGYRFIPRSEAPIAATSSAALPPPPPVPAVARPLSALVGRSDELGTLETLLGSGARLISIIGPGGMGKSRLAVELLHTHTVLGAPVHVQLIEGTTEAAVLEGLANKIHLKFDQESKGATAATQLGNALAQRGPTLLLMDNLDHDRGVLLEAIQTWLKLASELRIVATTRTRTQLQAEQIVELGPLLEADGVTLFVERARLLRPDFAPDEEMLETIASLVDALDGMPLAIELAAARVRLMSPEQILIRLSGSITFLRGNRPGGTGRHTGLRTMMASAWATLSDTEQRVLAGCTVFRSGFALSAAEAVIQPLIPDGDVMEIIEDLVDTSWLRAVESPQGMRFEQYSTIRAFIENQAETAGELETLRLAHMNWFLQESESRSNNIEDRADAKEITWLEIERANILAAVHQASQADPGIHARLLKGLIESDVARGAVWELNGLLDTLAPPHPDTPAAEAAELYGQRAHARRFIGRIHESKEDVDRALVLAQQTGDPDLVCSARYHAAWVEWDLRDYKAVREHLAVMEQHAPDGEKDHWDTRRLFMQAWADNRVGRHKEALEAGQRSIHLATRNNEPRRVAQAHQAMAYINMDLTHLADAIAHIQKAAEIFERIGDRGNVAYARNTLAMLYATDGEFAKAEPLLIDALVIIRERHDTHGIATMEGNLGAVRLGLHKIEEANQGLWECIRLHDAAAIPRGRSFYTAYLGAARAIAGELGSAEAFIGEADRLMKDSDFGQPVPFMAAIRAHISVAKARRAKESGADEEAAAHLEAARSLGLPPEGEPLAVGVVGFAQQLLTRAIDLS